MKIMELVLQATTPTGLWINKFNLINTSLSEGTNAALNIIESLGYNAAAPTAAVAGSVFKKYLDTTGSAFEFNQFYCRDIYSVSDFSQVTVSGSGWQGARSAAQPEPVFITSKLKSTRTRQDIKAGFKALPPMQDADVVNATGLLAAGILAVNQTLATGLGNGTSPFVGLAQAYFAWAICGKVDYVTDSGKTAYKYYPTRELQAENSAYPVSWVPVERATTQNSRKFGKGR